jgi:NhaA family Na+:H+ antiporter
MTDLKTRRIQALFLVASVPLGLLLGQWIDADSASEVSHLVEVYLLPLFFVGVGLELRHEFSAGYFKVRSNILSPLIAAVFGVVAPALIFITVAGSNGGAWSIPTATDITLGLAVLSFVAVGLSSELRARFLALATIDDVIGLLILLVVFSGELSWFAGLVTLVALVIFHYAQKLPTHLRYVAYLAGVVAIVAGAESGIQTSLIGVLVGLLISKSELFKWLEPVNGWIVLPLFGFFVSAVAAASFAGGIAAVVLSAILLRPLGKLIGILIGGSVASRIFNSQWDLRNWMAIGLLGGIGFTVSFLLAKLAYAGQQQSYGAAVLGTLGATAISALAFLAFAFFRARQVPQAEKSL